MSVFWLQADDGRCQDLSIRKKAKSNRAKRKTGLLIGQKLDDSPYLVKVYAGVSVQCQFDIFFFHFGVLATNSTLDGTDRQPFL